jgi:hypothetical protein
MRRVEGGRWFLVEKAIFQIPHATLQKRGFDG